MKSAQFRIAGGKTIVGGGGGAPMDRPEGKVERAEK